MELGRLTWKRLGVFLGGLILLLFAGLIFWYGWNVVQTQRSQVQVVPWSPAESSPYICFVAIKGTQQVQAMSCLRGVPPVGE